MFWTSRMASPPHHFTQNSNNYEQSDMRSFGPLPTPNQIPTSNSMESLVAPQTTDPMDSVVENQMNPSISERVPMSSNQRTPPHHAPIQMSMHHRPTEFPPALNHHEINQQPADEATTPPVPNQHRLRFKASNTVALCRFGEETVKYIFSSVQEVFNTIQQILDLDGTPQCLRTNNDTKAKLQDRLLTIRVLFKRLRYIYEKCNENCRLQGLEYINIESLISYKDEVDQKRYERKNSDDYRSACEEIEEIKEQIVLRNEQIKEIIDNLRRTISDINTVLTMRKS
nr:mediator of RNA polymerase II transcription subunit 30-like [Leptinotarsa decemlineata]